MSVCLVLFKVGHTHVCSVYHIYMVWVFHNHGWQREVQFVMCNISGHHWVSNVAPQPCFGQWKDSCNWIYMNKFLDNISGRIVQFKNEEHYSSWKLRTPINSFSFIRIVTWPKSTHANCLWSVWLMGKLHCVVKRGYTTWCLKMTVICWIPSVYTLSLHGVDDQIPPKCCGPDFPRDFFLRCSSSENQLFADNLISVIKWHLQFGYHKFILQGL